jgi:NAD(P)-dependent dehydrogenase (short-subunit alcohol dehydrogenase family)
MTSDGSSPCILVAGAGGGIGSAVARRLHAEGYRLSLLDIDEAALLNTASQLGDTPHVVVGDLADPEIAPRWLARASALNEPITGVVHAIGIVPPQGTVISLDAQLWRKVIDTNLTSAYLLVRLRFQL